MKKITSFLMMMVLCCIGAYAQDVETVGTQLPQDKLIKVGTAQAEMEPGKWYFLYQNRGNGTFYEPGAEFGSGGGFVNDPGVGGQISKSPSSVTDGLNAPEGVNSANYLGYLVRFMHADGQEGAFNIEFGSGNWIGACPNHASGRILSVSKIQHMAGESGEYNFYLIKTDDMPEGNNLGRFGWNRYDMDVIVDNDSPAGNHGGLLSPWSTGETKNTLEGNKVWQIFDIQIVGEVDVYAEALNSLLDEYTRITGLQDGAFIENLQNGVNVGDSYGNYRMEDVTAFLAVQAKIEEIMFTWEMEGQEVIEEMYPTAEDVEALIEEYTAAYEKIVENKVPIAMSNIKPGYYTINSMLNWYETKNDTIFLTQEEADSINNENGYLEGDEGFAVAGGVKEITSGQVPAPIKSLCSRDSDGQGWLAWGTQEPKAEYLWKIETVEGKPTEYRLINMYRGTTFVGITQSNNAQLNPNDTATVCFDWRSDAGVAPVTGNTVTYFNIRSSVHPENSFNYLHCGGHNGGAGKQAWIVGWSDGGATQWYLASVDEATANEWLEAGNKVVKLAEKITKGDSIAAVVPAQIEVAKDIETTLHMEDSVVVTSDQFYSQYTTEDSQTIPEGGSVYDFMIDGKQSTYWHSAWENGNQPFKKHYLQISATETLDGIYAVKLTRRPVSGDHIMQLIVKGYTEAPTDETTFEEGTELGVLDFPLGSNNETLVSRTFDATGMNYLRFYSNATGTTGGGGQDRGYWHASEFNVFKATAAKRFDTVQYDVRKAQADAIEAAIAAWEEKGFFADSVELAEDETFEAAYNALVAAYEAWTAVYVDPTDLRDAIAAAPAENLFVIGNNPGQWKEGVVTPKATVDKAAAYNAAGKYTAAESQAHIDAIEAAEDAVFDAANKVETGKWYRFRFASEEMYDNYGWDKAGPSANIHAASEVETAPALFNRIVAAGDKVKVYTHYDGENGADTVASYALAAAEYWFENDELYFFDGDEEFEYGEDLFQFVEATDSSYFIQHKATGLFLKTGHPVTLSAIPSYWNASAIGAGANIVASTDIFGTKANPLHAEKATSRLVTWNATTLGSNSMMMIEEVEAVEEAPSAEFTKQIWPGKINTYTYPVDIKVVEGATAYGASLNVTEEDTTIVLKAIEAEVIKAGTPFILIAEVDEYKTTADRLKEIAAELAADGVYGFEDKALAELQLLDEYAQVTMEHGMAVDTVANELNDLVGTLKQTAVEAGKGIVTNGENGFKHMLVNGNVAAYSAYIKADFDATSEDVLKGLQIEIDGSIDTGINEVLNKVAQSGNIYTVGGQLVGKGNINTVNKLPAGVYIVNGVKVTKK